jgi:hypothetical protein
MKNARELRAAFRAGVQWGAEKGAKVHPYPDAPCGPCDREAEKRYPLPMVTRPRVVTDSFAIAWRLADGALEFRLSQSAPWRVTPHYGPMGVTVERIRLWADLLANPTEQVEDEEAQ